MKLYIVILTILICNAMTMRNQKPGDNEQKRPVEIEMVPWISEYDHDNDNDAHDICSTRVQPLKSIITDVDTEVVPNDTKLKITDHELKNQVSKSIRDGLYNNNCSEQEIFEENKKLIEATNKVFDHSASRILNRLPKIVVRAMKCISSKFSDYHKKLKSIYGVTDKVTKEEKIKDDNFAADNFENIRLAKCLKNNDSVSANTKLRKRIFGPKTGKGIEMVAEVSFGVFQGMMRDFAILSLAVLAVVFTLLAIFVWPYIAIAAGVCATIILAIALKSKKHKY